MAFEYTAEQQRVFTHPLDRDGVLRAGPGTGKSSTVVELARRLRDAHPGATIRFITFTRAATAELAKKITGIEALGVRPSTMHSFAASLLMRNQDAIRVACPLRINSESEWKDILNPYLRRRLGFTWRKVDALLKLMAAMWQSMGEEPSAKYSPADRSRFKGAYDEAVRLFEFTPLDELPDLLRELLSVHDDVKGSGIDFMIVDEYQDLNMCEIELLKLLRKRGTRLLAVGDEDQSIYSMRKAHPIGIREFKRDFADSLEYDLTECHRCPKKMLDWAQHVIHQDLKRSVRPLPRPHPAKDAKVKLLHFKSEKSEATGVAQLIAELVNNRAVPPHEILVLTRTDTHQKFTKEIKRELRERDISTFDLHEQKALLATANSRLLLAYLRLVDNPTDSLAWSMILLLKKGFGTAAVERCTTKAVDSGHTFAAALFRDVSDSPNTRLARFVAEVSAKLEKLKASRISAPDRNWGAWIDTQAAEITGERLPEELGTLFREMDTRQVGEPIALAYYLAQLEPTMKDLANEQQKGVRFMAMSGSKGLTALATFVVGVDDDLIPSPMNQQRDEETRLLYVAMTRAQERLVMTWAQKRGGNQAHAGRGSAGKPRNYTQLLRHGPVKSERGEDFVASVVKTSPRKAKTSNASS